MTPFFIVTAMKTSNLTLVDLFTLQAKRKKNTEMEGNNKRSKEIKEIEKEGRCLCIKEYRIIKKIPFFSRCPPRTLIH
jgi:hypothetical protein